jgi:hypothetical protein
MQRLPAFLLRLSSIVQSNISLNHKKLLPSWPAKLQLHLLHLPKLRMHNLLFNFLPFLVPQLVMMIFIIFWILQLLNLNLNAFFSSNRSPFANNFLPSRIIFLFVKHTILVLMKTLSSLQLLIPFLSLIFLVSKQKI